MWGWLEARGAHTKMSYDLCNWTKDVGRYCITVKLSKRDEGQGWKQLTACLNFCIFNWPKWTQTPHTLFRKFWISEQKKQFQLVGQAAESDGCCDFAELCHFPLSDFISQPNQPMPTFLQCGSVCYGPVVVLCCCFLRKQHHTFLQCLLILCQQNQATINLLSQSSEVVLLPLTLPSMLLTIQTQA